MNLKALNKVELDQRIKTLVTRERELLCEIILTIKEIDQRRTFLDLGFPNLFSYLTEGIGYSAGSAQRRIEAARLLKEIPSLEEKIESGEVKLNQISLVQKAARDVFKMTSMKVTAEEKKTLIEGLSNKNYQDSQKEVAVFFDIPVIADTKKQIQADESVRLEFTVSKDLYARIQQAQALLSTVPSNDILDYIEYLTDRVIKQKTTIRANSKIAVEAESLAGENSKKITGGDSFTSTVEVKAFSQRIKKSVFKQQICCQYFDPITKKQCQSHWFLQTDHKQSRWAGGASTIENVQLLCANHNRLKYSKEIGLKFKS